MWWIVILVVWLLGAVTSYELVFKKWTEDATKFEQIWYSVIWFLVLILYGIHSIHMKL